MDPIEKVPRDVTFCVLTFGNHFDLARRALESIMACCERRSYYLIAGANAVVPETSNYLEKLKDEGKIDHLFVSRENDLKCPMMRRMFERVKTEFIWWFDDDSYFKNTRAFQHWLNVARAAPQSTVMWGAVYYVDHSPDRFLHEGDAAEFVRGASWFRGLPPPSERNASPDSQAAGPSNGRWVFVTGGSWLIRTEAVRELGWPDPRLTHYHDDIFLGEAIRQRGWNFRNVDFGVAINDAPRRGNAWDRGGKIRTDS